MDGDKRRFMRFNTDLEAVAKRDSWLRPRSRYIVKDVSKEGLKLGSKTALNQGEALNLEVRLPSHKTPIMASGEVKWSRRIGPSEYSSGVKLRAIKPEEKFMLLDLAYENWVRNQKAAQKILNNL